MVNVQPSGMQSAVARGASRRIPRNILAAVLLSIVATLVLSPAAIADDRDTTDSTTCGDHGSADADHTHPTDSGSCTDAANIQPKEGSEGSRYIGELLGTPLGKEVERFAKWSAVVLVLYSVIWMLWPLFQSNRGGAGGGEQRKVFKNLILPLVVAAIAFDLDVTGGILDFFIRLVEAAGSTFTEIFG